MKKTYAFLFGVAISLMIGIANAQTITPDSFLGTDDNMKKQAPLPMPKPKPQIPAPEAQPPQFFPLPMQAQCLPMGAMKTMVEQVMGQETYLIGFNGNHLEQNSPFNGLIIAVNPDTRDYTIILVSSADNIACVVAIGTELRRKIPQNNK